MRNFAWPTFDFCFFCRTRLPFFASLLESCAAISTYNYIENSIFIFSERSKIEIVSTSSSVEWYRNSVLFLKHKQCYLFIHFVATLHFKPLILIGLGKFEYSKQYKTIQHRFIAHSYKDNTKVWSQSLRRLRMWKMGGYCTR